MWAILGAANHKTLNGPPLLVYSMNHASSDGGVTNLRTYTGAKLPARTFWGLLQTEFGRHGDWRVESRLRCSVKDCKLVLR